MRIRNGVKRILVIKLRHIGDVLLMVPTLRVLREHFPSAHLATLVNAGMEDVLSGSPLLDEIITFDRTQLKSRPWRRIKYEIRFIQEVRRRRFDLVVDLSRGDRAAFLAWFSGASLRIGWSPRGSGFWGKKYLYTNCERPIRHHIHTVEQNLDVVRQIGIDAPHRDLAIHIPDKDLRSIEEILRVEGAFPDGLRIQVHPTSRWLFKCWSDESMAKLIDLLSEQYGAKVILTCSPAPNEIEKAKRILKMAKSKPIDLIGRTSLKQLASVSKLSHLFIGVDSAPMHIAAAVKTPVIAIFGPSGEFSWGPWGDGHTVIAKEMPCRPCGQAGCDNSKRSECLETLSVEEVWQAVNGKIRSLVFKAKIERSSILAS